MREIHLLPLLCPPFALVFYLAEPPESGDKSGLVQEDGEEPLAWLHSPRHLSTAPAFSSLGEDSKKTGVPQVLWMLLAPHGSISTWLDSFEHHNATSSCSAEGDHEF